MGETFKNLLLTQNEEYITTKQLAHEYNKPDRVHNTAKVQTINKARKTKHKQQQ